MTFEHTEIYTLAPDYLLSAHQNKERGALNQILSYFIKSESGTLGSRSDEALATTTATSDHKHQCLSERYTKSSDGRKSD